MGFYIKIYNLIKPCFLKKCFNVSYYKILTVNFYIFQDVTYILSLNCNKKQKQYITFSLILIDCRICTNFGATENPTIGKSLKIL